MLLLLLLFNTLLSCQIGNTWGWLPSFWRIILVYSFAYTLLGYFIHSLFLTLFFYLLLLVVMYAMVILFLTSSHKLKGIYTYMV